MEHIFPQNPKFNVVKFGFADLIEYEQFLNQIGNLTFVDRSNNASLSNQPPDVKAHLYLTNIIKMTKRVGGQLLPLTTDYHGYRLVLILRCTELAIFSFKRFF